MGYCKRITTNDMTGNININVIMRGVRVVTVTTETQQLVHILSVSVALIIQHGMPMRPIILSSVASPAVPYFSTISHKRPH